MTDLHHPEDLDSAPPPSSWRPTIATVVVLALIGAVGLWWRSAVDEADSSPPGRGSGISRVVQQFEPAEREVPSEFNARLLDGSSFDSTSLRGRVAVYNVWGSWCGPCRTEAPDLAEIAQQYADTVRFVGINVRDNPAAAAAFEREFDVPYPSVHPDDSAAAILSFGGALTAAAVPSTVILDEEGRVAARVVGPVTASTLGGLIDDVLAGGTP